MSYFSTALTRYLERTRTTQKALAEATGLTVPEINRYANGTRPISRAKLDSLLTKLEPGGGRSQLTYAYVLDQIPNSLRSDVVVEPSEKMKGKADNRSFDDGISLPEETLKVLQFIAKRARHDDPTRNFLQGLGGLMGVSAKG
ncbi:hypothetical protein BH23VER1_BH23VER1_20500 [soil metagenome]